MKPHLMTRCRGYSRADLTFYSWELLQKLRTRGVRRAGSIDGDGAGGRGRGSEGVKVPGVAGGVNAGLRREGGGACDVLLS